MLNPPSLCNLGPHSEIAWHLSFLGAGFKQYQGALLQPLVGVTLTTRPDLNQTFLTASHHPASFTFARVAGPIF